MKFTRRYLNLFQKLFPLVKSQIKLDFIILITFNIVHLHYSRFLRLIESIYVQNEISNII